MTTETQSHYNHLEKMSTPDLLKNINQEDHKISGVVEKAIPQIDKLVKVIVEKMKQGGRLFYIGAGTSGRLGVLDASEIPPTYGMPYDKVIGLIAGGDGAIRKAVERAEDDALGAWRDLQPYRISSSDVLVGIAASGRTPYVVGGLKEAQQHSIVTGCITCNADSSVAAVADYPIEIVVGPEFVTGSTRMKAGTAQKLVLNMISTTTMIQLGRVSGSRMVDMMLSNEKLVDRGARMVMKELGVDEKKAMQLLKEYGSVRKAVEKR